MMRGARVCLRPRQEDLWLLRVREAVPFAARPGAARAGAHGREAVPVPGVRQVLPSRVLPQTPPAAARRRAALPLPCLRQGLHHAQQPLQTPEAAPGHGLTRPGLCPAVRPPLPGGLDSRPGPRGPRDHEGGPPLALQSQARALGRGDPGWRTGDHPEPARAPELVGGKTNLKGPGSIERLVTSRPLEHVLSTPKSIGL